MLAASPPNPLFVFERQSRTIPGVPALPEVESLRLLQGRREVLIRHGNECCRLRHTHNDKLILTK